MEKKAVMQGTEEAREAQVQETEEAREAQVQGTYRDASLTPEERAYDLLKRMTLDEKVGQLNQRLYGFRIYERTEEGIRLTEEFCREVERFSGLGVLYGLYRADPWADRTPENGITPKLSAQAYNLVQKYVMEHSRLGIPMLLSTECPHGHQALGGALLPVNLAAGASFDPELLEEGYRACGRQLASGKVDLALMSVLDVLRDPRWGRSEECYSEDPYLSARMAEAAVKGMQSAGVACVAKHFCAQGETTGGINASAARIGERELREIHLPPAKACCQAGVEGVMAAYNEIDGICCHANARLLRNVLREELGFRGVVMADGVAIDLLETMTGDKVSAGAAALRAGVDISLWDEAYSRLEEAVEQGMVEEELLDEAVMRVLELKFKRGLFERPLLEKPMLEAEECGVHPVSLQLARESAVLLLNRNGLLPLTGAGTDAGRMPMRKIAVIGCQAQDRYGMLGDYTPPVPEEECVTVLEGLQRLSPSGVEVRYARGCGFFRELLEEKEKALSLVRESDVAVVVIGGSSSRFGGAQFDANGAAIAAEQENAMDCGEGMDCALLRIPQAQEELLREAAACGKPVVAVILAGRPYIMEDIRRYCDALLYAFYPGPWGGQAIAELLYGLEAPSGRLPVSLPLDAGQLPACYNHRTSYTPGRYYDRKGRAGFDFGEGLSYTRFALKQAAVESADADGIRVRAQLLNEGTRRGCAVPMLYLRRLSGASVPRIRELKAFQRVELEAGEETCVCFRIPAQECLEINAAYQEVPYRGRLKLILQEGAQEYWSTEITL